MSNMSSLSWLQLFLDSNLETTCCVAPFAGQATKRRKQQAAAWTFCNEVWLLILLADDMFELWYGLSVVRIIDVSVLFEPSQVERHFMLKSAMFLFSNLSTLPTCEQFTEVSKRPNIPVPKKTPDFGVRKGRGRLCASGETQGRRHLGPGGRSFGGGPKAKRPGGACHWERGWPTISRNQ